MALWHGGQTATGDTTARAKIVCKYLEMVGRTDVDVGVGVPNDNSSTNNPLYGWATDYNLTSYPGRLFTDGVGAMINAINSSPTPVSLIAIAPATNFPSLLQRAPEVVKNAAVFAMSGSIYRGYGNSSTPAAGEATAASSVVTEVGVNEFGEVSVLSRAGDVCAQCVWCT